MKTAHIRLTGMPGSAMLTHNERLASKLDPITRQMAAIASKRKKTDEDMEEIARLELVGGVYETDDGLVGIPTWNVFRALQDGAKVNRLGKAVERGLVPAGPDIVPIKHDGPNTVRAMWEQNCYDQRSVKVGMSKVTRTRPRFSNWVVETTFLVDTELLQWDDLVMIAENAGRFVGLGDYRPRFGRFEATVEEAA